MTRGSGSRKRRILHDPSRVGVQWAFGDIGKTVEEEPLRRIEPCGATWHAQRLPGEARKLPRQNQELQQTEEANLKGMDDH